MKKILVTLLALASILSPGTTFASAPAIQSSAQVYDFGDIDREQGPVSTTFTITNAGDEALQINRLSTSCGCTTAVMDQSDILPGESRPMEVTFDPNVHPDQFGEITRMVYLQTSDPQLPELELELIGNILGGAENQATDSAAKPIQSETQAIVFFNEACWDCGELVNERYPELFAEYEIGLVKKDYINERENRLELNRLNDEWGIPFELQSHIEAFVGENLLIGGHVPEPIIRYVIENPDAYDKLLIYQDKMHGEGTDYKVWDFKGEIKTYPLDEPITTYLSENHEAWGRNLSRSTLGLFTVITTSAFLDGINPCAIAVLLFFIAFLFSIKRTKRSIWKMGLVYIGAIYLAYFLIGIGIAQAIIISGAPHLMASVGAYLVIALGIIQLLGIIFPKFPIRLRIPIDTKATMEKWLYKGTLPAAFIGGFIVGLCTFPCSGGIYVAIIGMLSASQTYLSGFLWMIWYNLIFISPLLILLALAANPKSTEKLQQWERKESKRSKVLIGLTMIALGLIILIFFT